MIVMQLSVTVVIYLDISTPSSLWRMWTKNSFNKEHLAE